MAQSSLMAWLTKPGAVEDPPPTYPTDERPAPLPASSDVSTPSHLPNHDHMVTNSRMLPQETTKQKLPVNVELRACTKEDLQSLKLLTSLLLPIAYPDKFYREIIEDELTNNITLLALWHDDPSTKSKAKGRLIGAIRCRLLAHPPASDRSSKEAGPMLYLSTLAILSPYRGHGIATHMLKVLTKRAVDDYDITSVGAHVWEANCDGLAWYRRRGFAEVAKEKDYYRRLSPMGAVVMRKAVGVMDLVGACGDSKRIPGGSRGTS